MKRRELLLLLSSALIASRALRAQQVAMPVVGVLNVAKLGPMSSDAFHQGLSETGYVEGKNVRIEYRWAENHYDRLPALAADLVARNVNVIAALTDSAAVVAKNATATIPIVFAVGIDPLEAGLVTSLARPDGNLTGSSGLLADLMAKRLDLLSELVPQARVIALLVNPKSAVAEQVIGKVQEAARAKDRQLCILKAETESELNAAFATLGERRAGALLVAPDNFFLRDQILALVARRSIPAIYPWRESVAAGGLISYGTNVVAVYRQSGTYVGKILKGAKPADLPVQLPTTFEMAINLKTANALGLTIPPEILARADDVIE